MELDPAPLDRRSCVRFPIVRETEGKVQGIVLATAAIAP
jgi:hypothetical protein